MIDQQTKSLTARLVEAEAKIRALEQRAGRGRGAQIMWGLGVLTEEVTIEASTDSHEFTASTASVILFASTDANRLNYTATDHEIEAVILPPGTYEVGSLCYLLRPPHDRWHIVSIGCNPIIPGFVP